MAATYVFSLQNNEATEYRKKEEGRRREGNARKGWNGWAWEIKIWHCCLIQFLLQYINGRRH